MSKKRDYYFMKIAKMVASQSSCLSRKLGAVLVKDKYIIATGFNGPPTGVPHCNSREWYNGLISILQNNNIEIPDNFTFDATQNTCPRKLLGYKSGEGLHLCPAVHAERNCLLMAARLGISTLDTTLYTYSPFPCKDCLIELINAGVKEIIAPRQEPQFYDDLSKLILNISSNIKYRVMEFDDED